MSGHDANEATHVAREYVLAELFPDGDAAEIVGMTRTGEIGLESVNAATRVGVKVPGSGLLSGDRYATVTVDESGTVTLANRCTRRECFEKVDRKDPAEEFAENVEAAKDAVDSMLGDSGPSEPAKCPNCGKSAGAFGLGFTSLWKEVNDGSYQCRDCGHIVNVGGSFGALDK